MFLDLFLLIPADCSSDGSTSEKVIDEIPSAFPEGKAFPMTSATIDQYEPEEAQYAVDHLNDQNLTGIRKSE